jgi:hypothetical protein
MSNENLNIVPTTGNAEQDQAALIEGKLVWLGERADGDTAVYLFHDDEDGYFLQEAIRRGAEGSETCASRTVASGGLTRGRRDRLLLSVYRYDQPVRS